MNKVYPSAEAALAGIVRDGQLMAVGGFRPVRNPRAIDRCPARQRRQGSDRDLEQRRHRRQGSGQAAHHAPDPQDDFGYVGENKEFERQYLSGELELDFTPQGTLAEKLRAGGAGIPAFYTKTGVGTLVAEGKETHEFDGQTYVMERALVPDVSLVKAYVADRAGNLLFRKTARNFNPNVAQAGRITVVEVEKLVEIASSIPSTCICPGIFVHRIVVNPTPNKYIEQRTTRPA